MTDDDAIPWEARFRRERAARQEAEALLHAKARDLYDANQELTARAAELSASLAQLRDTQAALFEREKLANLGGQVAGFAHDLNTPLGVAITAVSHGQERLGALASRLDAGNLTRSELRRHLDEAREALALVRSNLHRGASLVSSFKQVVVDQVSEERREARLGQLVDELATSLRPLLRAEGVAVERRGDDPLAILEAGAFCQILANLIQNAAIHAFEGRPAPHQVRVSVEDGPAALRLTVADTGRGMSPAVAAAVFDPFFTTRRGRGGSGLGMSIVHELVTHRFGGQIALETAEGAGTTWRITLPWGSAALGRPSAPADPGAAP